MQPSAGLPSSHSFHGEVSSYGWLLLSIPLVQLCAAHTPKPRRARFRAPPGSASLRRLTAPPCAPSIANYETNVFYWPAKAQFPPLEAHPTCPRSPEHRPETPPNSIPRLNPCSVPMKPLNCSKSIPRPCSAWRDNDKFREFKSANFGAFADRN